MDFGGLNYLAVGVATLASYAFGSIYYMTLGKPWMAALGKTPEEMKGGPLPFIIAFLGQLVMAFMLAGLIGHLGTGQGNLSNAVLSGVFVWAGFVLPAMVINYGFQGQKRMLWLIDGGHWLGVLAIQGLVLGLFGV